MGPNDAIAPLVEERLGVRTFAADELGWLLTGMLELREHAPVEIDASGGLSAITDLRGALEPLAAELRERSARNARRHRLERSLQPPPGDDQSRRCPPRAPTPRRAPPRRFPSTGCAPRTWS